MLKKLFMYASLLTMLVLGSALVSSCSKDNETITTTNKLVGTWIYNWDGASYCLLTFNADGTGTLLEIEDGSYDYDLAILYTYDDKTEVLKINYLDGGKIIDTENVKLIWINNNSFIGPLDKDAVWTRQ